MEKLVEKINICFENLKNQVCILELDGPVSASTEDLLIDYKINKWYFSFNCPMVASSPSYKLPPWIRRYPFSYSPQ